MDLKSDPGPYVPLNKLKCPFVCSQPKFPGKSECQPPKSLIVSKLMLLSGPITIGITGGRVGVNKAVVTF